MTALLRISGSITTLCLLECIAGPVYGQATAAPGPNNQAVSQQTSPRGLEEIIVTAQRRGEDLQTVPVAVTALTAEALADSGITDSQQLYQVTPGLVTYRTSNAGTVVLRGVGTFVGSLSDENAVATYIDGVYISSFSGALYSFNNIERVEVLRGPQGTLFGRNATGGVIQVITKDPQQEPSADITAGYGNYDTVESTFYGTAGIASNLAADLAIHYEDQGEGWGTNVFNGRDAHVESNLNLRSKWRLSIGADTTATLAVDYSRYETDSGHESRAFPGQVLTDGSGYPGFYNVNADADFLSLTKQGGVALTVDHDFSWARLVSISAWREYVDTAIADQDGTPSDVFRGRLDTEVRTWTQELQLLSPESAAVSWVAGLYYLDTEATVDPFIGSGAGATMSGAYAPPGPPPPFTAQYIKIAGEQSVTSYAAFGQVTFPIVSDTNLSLGARYTSDEREIENASSVGVLTPGGIVELIPPGGGPFTQDASFDEVTYRIALDHQFTPSIMGYVLYSRGFKGGFFNDFAPGEPAVDPETLDDYEAGIKSEWLDDRLRLNLSGFYYDFQDIQLSILTAGGLLNTTNAAGATARGAELEFQAIPLEHLSLRGGISYTETEFTDFPNALFLVPNPLFPLIPLVNLPTSQNAAGNEMPYSPRWAANVGAAYEIPTKMGTWTLAATYSYNDGYFGGIENTTKLPSFGIVNASINLRSPDGAIGARLWANNLLDEQYLTRAASSAFGNYATPGAPLTFGASLSFHWD